MTQQRPTDDVDERLPLPSEDTGDLVQTPPAGITDDPLVPERNDTVQPYDAALPRDGELLSDVLEMLRASDVSAGDHLAIDVQGRTVIVSGEVESIDILDEIVGMVGDVAGVDGVVDQLKVTAI